MTPYYYYTATTTCYDSTDSYSAGTCRSYRRRVVVYAHADTTQTYYLAAELRKALTQRQHLSRLLASLGQPAPVPDVRPRHRGVGVREREQSYLRRQHQRL